MPYQRALIAVDLTDSSEIVVQRAIDLLSPDAEVHLVHVSETLAYAPSGDIPIDVSSIQQQDYENVRHLMSELAEHFKIDEERVHLPVGRPEDEIVKIAETVQADLLLIGNRTRPGLGTTLRGSKVLQIVKMLGCDILALRHKDDEHAG